MVNESTGYSPHPTLSPEGRGTNSPTPKEREAISPSPEGRGVRSSTFAAAPRILHEDHRVRVDSILILALGLAAFLIAPSPEFVGLEARFALFAQNMLREGPSFFPRTYLGPYPDYPGTCTFLIYLPAKLVGKVTPFCAILPTAIVSSIILLTIYRIGVLHSRRWGWCAVFVSLLTGEFEAASRGISPDQCTALVTALCFFCTIRDLRGVDRGVYGRVALALAAGFACRGPIGLVVPAGVVCAVYAAESKWRRAFWIGVIALSLILSGAVFLLLAARHEGGDEFAREVFKMQMFGRISSGRGGLAYYWIHGFTSYAIAYPLAAFVLIASSRRILNFGETRGDVRLLRSLSVWALVVLVGLSIPGDKKARYLLPAASAFALIAAYLLIAEAPTGLWKRIREIFLRLAGWTPALCLVVAGVVFFLRSRLPEPLDNIRLLTSMAVLMICTLLAVLAGVARFHAGNHSHYVRANMQDPGIQRLAVAAASFVVLHIGVIEPIVHNLEGCAPFAHAVGRELIRERAGLIFWRLGPDQEDIKLMINLDSSMRPGFASTTEDLLQNRTSTLFIAQAEAFENLPREIKARAVIGAEGKIGHERCIAFHMTVEK